MNYNAALNRLANSYFAQPPGTCLSRWYDCISGCIFFTSRLRGLAANRSLQVAPFKEVKTPGCEALSSSVIFPKNST